MPPMNLMAFRSFWVSRIAMLFSLSTEMSPALRQHMQSPSARCFVRRQKFCTWQYFRIQHKEPPALRQHVQHPLPLIFSEDKEFAHGNIFAFSTKIPCFAAARLAPVPPNIFRKQRLCKRQQLLIQHRNAPPHLRSICGTIDITALSARDKICAMNKTMHCCNSNKFPHKRQMICHNMYF